MKAIVLAAGYATRLRPLTEQVPKPLLPLAGRPMLDYLCDKLDAVGEIDAIHVVTNGRFAQSFVEWAGAREGRAAVRVHDDGTTTNGDREVWHGLGSIRLGQHDERARDEHVRQ